MLCGAVAQPGERHIRIAEVGSSILLGSTTRLKAGRQMPLAGAEVGTAEVGASREQDFTGMAIFTAR